METIPAPTTADVELVYVGDPMCSWCWAFDPVLAALDQRYTFPIVTVVGGLRPGPSAQTLDDDMRAMLRHHWETIAAKTSVPFDFSQLDREGWVYDTELPARAVVTMRGLDETAVRPFFSRLQRAFYAEKVDITDTSVYPQLLDDFDVDPEVFMTRLTDEASRTEAWADFAQARRLGISGFPTLLVRIDDTLSIVTRGYAPFDRVEPALTAWLDEQAGIVDRGMVCEIGEVC